MVLGAPDEEVAGTEAVILLANHRELDLGVLERRARFVLDTRRVLAAADNVEHL